MDYEKTGRGFLLTSGGNVSLADGNKPRIAEFGSRDFLLRNVYLDPNVMAESCRSFLLSFHVDTPQGTFVYDRSLDDGVEVGTWLRVLHRLGLLEVTQHTAQVCHQYLEVFNAFLAQVRESLTTRALSALVETDEIGNFAEERALDYEASRLKQLGHPDLALLVQRISSIDRSAGYDLLSSKGTGKNPEQPIYIEVKGTLRNEVGFIWTRNEWNVAQERRTAYWIYVFTHIDLATCSARGLVQINDPCKRLVELGYQVEALNVYVSKRSMSNPRRWGHVVAILT